MADADNIVGVVSAFDFCIATDLFYLGNHLGGTMHSLFITIFTGMTVSTTGGTFYV